MKWIAYGTPRSGTRDQIDDEVAGSSAQGQKYHQRHANAKCKPKLEKVERQQLLYIFDILLHRQLGFASHTLLECDRHVNYILAPAPHHQLQTDFEAHSVDAFALALREPLPREAEEPRHWVCRWRDRTGEQRRPGGNDTAHK
eukprot:CAMPEP_0115859112 /NCGR_PEP_ID=MMETSP0287-20121206/16445_1 /TAXON_ID=412157 /ORGANISM="Chrysochromulina rotalis, Strain UIO044" /LENGTH=142 /DNA_ID=CAMNT_0003313397 /DNA_START=246 /DNA_END=674 /DNA_ORIENTATION=-